MITDINHLDFSKKYSYADYLTWHFDEMVELRIIKRITYNIWLLNLLLLFPA